jgi:hypothetical protein
MCVECNMVLCTVSYAVHTNKEKFKKNILYICNKATSIVDLPTTYHLRH